MTYLLLVLAITAGAIIVGATAVYFLRARFRETIEAASRPTLASAAAPVLAPDEVQAIGDQIARVMSEQRLQGETQRQVLAQKLDSVRQSVDSQRAQVDGLRNEMRHEVRRRDAELEEIRHQIGTIQSAVALPPAAPAALLPASTDVSQTEPPPPAAPWHAEDDCSSIAPEPIQAEPAAEDETVFEDEAVFEDETIEAEPIQAEPVAEDEAGFEDDPSVSAAPESSADVAPPALEPWAPASVEAPSGPFDDEIFGDGPFGDSTSTRIDLGPPAGAAPFGGSLFDGPGALDAASVFEAWVPQPTSAPAPTDAPAFTEHKDRPHAEAFEPGPMMRAEGLSWIVPDQPTTPPADEEQSTWSVEASEVFQVEAKPVDAHADVESLSSLNASDEPETEIFAAETPASGDPTEPAAAASPSRETAPDREPTTLAAPLATPAATAPDATPDIDPSWIARPDRPAADAPAPVVASADDFFSFPRPSEPAVSAPAGLVDLDAFAAPVVAPEPPAPAEPEPLADAPDETGDPADPSQGPRDADDLTVITSIDEDVQRRLYLEGVTSLEEIAQWGRTRARQIALRVEVSEETIMTQWVFEAQAAMFNQFSRQAGV